MTKLSWSILVACIASAPASAFASHVSPASLGAHVDPGDETCFHEIWGAMRNDCPTPRRFAIPVHTYWAGWQEARVSVTAHNPARWVRCELITALDGAPYNIGASDFTSVYGSADLLYLSAIFADRNPGWVLCTVHPGAQVNHVWFSGS